MGGQVEQQHDELTDTGVIRFQEAASQSMARFVSHFIREPELPEPSALSKVAA